MALAVNSEMPTNTGFGANNNPLATPQTFSFTNTAGTVLYVCVGLGVSGAATATIDSVTYNSVAMTKIVDKTTSGGATGGHTSWWRLLSPATGANTFSIAFTAPSALTDLWAGAISFTGNNTSTPEAQSGGTQGTGTTATGSLTGVATGNLTICGAGAGSAMTGQSISQTLTWAEDLDNGTSLGNGKATRSASTGSVSHTFGISASDSWATGIIEVAAAGAAVAPFRPVVSRLQAVNTAASW